MIQGYAWWATSSVESLEVDPISGILQEVIIKVSEDIFPLDETSVDDIRAIPHGFELPFPNIIIGLVVNED